MQTNQPAFLSSPAAVSPPLLASLQLMQRLGYFHVWSTIWRPMGACLSSCTRPQPLHHSCLARSGWLLVVDGSGPVLLLPPHHRAGECCYYITPHHRTGQCCTASHHITPRHITLYHTTSQDRTLLHHTTSHDRTLLHHITQHNTTHIPGVGVDKPVRGWRDGGMNG